MSACIVCGCTEQQACVDDDGPCAWVLLDVDQLAGVCSACVTLAKKNPHALVEALVQLMRVRRAGGPGLPPAKASKHHRGRT